MKDAIFYPVFLTLLLIGGSLMYVAYDQMGDREASRADAAPSAYVIG